MGGFLIKALHEKSLECQSASPFSLDLFRVTDPNVQWYNAKNAETIFNDAKGMAFQQILLNSCPKIY